MTTEETTPLVEREPAQGTIWGPEVLERTGLEMMRAAVGRALPGPAITRPTRLRLTHARLGTASSSMHASFWCQPGSGCFLA